MSFDPKQPRDAEGKWTFGGALKRHVERHKALTVFHESPGDQVSSFMKQGIIAKNRKVFATIGQKSDYVDQNITRTVLKVRIPGKFAKMWIQPDRDDLALSNDPSMGRNKKSLKGVDVIFPTNVPASWIKSAKVVQGKIKKDFK